MKTRLAWRNGVVAMVFALGMGSAQAGFEVIFDPNDATKAIGIMNLAVVDEPVPFDVLFTPSTTASNIYGDFDLMGNNYDFSTNAAAQNAVFAAVNALNFADAETIGTTMTVGSLLFRVPFESIAVGEVEAVLYWEGLREAVPPGPWLPALMIDGDAYFLGERVWARFTVVPAPATVWLLAPAIAALGGRRRRRTM